MKIVESWEDHRNNTYAIVRYSKKDQRDYKIKKYESAWVLDDELYSFGASAGYWIADFDTLEEAQEFLLKGISLDAISISEQDGHSQVGSLYPAQILIGRHVM